VFDYTALSTLTIETLDPNVGGQSELSMNWPGSNRILDSVHSLVGFLDPIDEMAEPLNTPLEHTAKGERNSQAAKGVVQTIIISKHSQSMEITRG
jgi:hypothetical protein